MLSLVGLALAATGLMPQPVDEVSWFPADAYPPRALMNGDQGLVGYQAVITPEGKVSKCDVTVSSGSKPLDLTTCILVIRFGKFKAGHDGEGHSTFGIYQNWIRWDADAPVKMPPPPPKTDMDVALRVIPPSALARPRVDADIIVRADGSIESCTPVASKSAEILGDIACRQVRQHWTPGVAIDDKSVKQRSVQRVRVGFTDEAHPN